LRLDEGVVAPCAEVLVGEVVGCEPRADQCGCGDGHLDDDVEHDDPREGDDKIVNNDVYFVIRQP